nr:helix-turn-helix domain-containing protein [uncultured Rhodococcus sp.]
MRYAWRRLVVRDGHLTDATRRVLLELESYANPDGTNARPGVRRIAENLASGDGFVNEKTVRRALATGVERGLIECVEKGHTGRGRNTADVYRLAFESLPPDIQVSTGETSTTGHSDVHRSSATSGHFDMTSGHFTPDHRTPECPPTSSLHQFTTPEKSGGGTFATTDRDAPRSRPVPAEGWKLVRSTIPDTHPQAVRTDLAIRAGALTKSGTPAETVEAALRLWLTKPNLGPGTLPSLVSEVLKTQQPTSNMGPASQKAAGWLAVGHNLAMSTADKRVAQAQSLRALYENDAPHSPKELT